MRPVRRCDWPEASAMTVEIELTIYGLVHLGTRKQGREFVSSIIETHLGNGSPFKADDEITARRLIRAAAAGYKTLKLQGLFHGVVKA